MSRTGEAGMCPDCYKVSQEWFDHNVCPNCEECRAQMDARESHSFIDEPETIS